MPDTRHASAADTTAAVDAYMAGLDHPHKAVVQALRELILSCAPEVREGVKWNAPSYRTHEYFATTQLRVKAEGQGKAGGKGKTEGKRNAVANDKAEGDAGGGVGIILHLGAKVRETPVRIDDPGQLLTWHGANRASFAVRDIDQLNARAPALRAILAQWLAHV